VAKRPPGLSLPEAPVAKFYKSLNQKRAAIAAESVGSEGEAKQGDPLSRASQGASHKSAASAGTGSLGGLQAQRPQEVQSAAAREAATVYPPPDSPRPERLADVDCHWPAVPAEDESAPPLPAREGPSGPEPLTLSAVLSLPPDEAQAATRLMKGAELPSGEGVYRPTDIRDYFAAKRACPAAPPVRDPVPRKGRFWKSFMDNHQRRPRAPGLKMSALVFLGQRFGPLPTALEGQAMTLDPISITAMEFDPMGSLLAVGTSAGAVCIYDFDEYLELHRAKG
jgi:hypothetical protein